MPNNYSGNPASYQVQRALIVNDATNAPPIVARTSAPHGFQTGDLVVVQGVSGNTAANSNPNAPWPIVVTDSTHFQLVGSVGNGAFSGNGRVYDLNLNPPLALQSDADTDNASGRNVPLQTVGDRAAYLASALPYVRPINVYQTGISDDAWSAWATHSLAGGTGWDILKNSSTPVGDLFAFSAPVPLINFGDMLDVRWNVGRFANTAAGAMLVAFQASSVAANAWNVGATSPYNVGEARHFPASYDGPIAGSSLLRISTPTGLTASIIAFSTPTARVSIPSPATFSTASVGDTITIFGAASPGNNGTFPIVGYNSSVSVNYTNPNAVAGDANNGAIGWYITNMKFNLALYWDDLGGGANSYVAYGHRSMSVIHHRPPQITIPLL